MTGTSSRSPHLQVGVVHVSGVLADITGTLPDDDPWRSLVLHDGSARWPDPDRPPFGTWESVTDVIEPSSDAPGLDPAFLALEEPIHPMATGLIRTSFAGWAETVEPLRGIPDGAGQPQTFDIATAAIRFAVHRRRSYGLPTDDVWPVVSGFAWAWRASWVVAGRPIDDEQIAKSIRLEKIQPQAPT